MLSHALQLSDITGQSIDSIVWPLNWLDEAMLLLGGHIDAHTAGQRVVGDSRFSQSCARPCALTLRWAEFDRHTADCDGVLLDDDGTAYDPADGPPQSPVGEFIPEECSCQRDIGEHTGDDKVTRLVSSQTPGAVPVTLAYWKQTDWQDCDPACGCNSGRYDARHEGLYALVRALTLPGHDEDALDAESAWAEPRAGPVRRRPVRSTREFTRPTRAPDGPDSGNGERLLIGVPGGLMAALLVDYLLSHPLVLAGLVLVIGVLVLVAALLPRRQAAPRTGWASRCRMAPGDEQETERASPDVRSKKIRGRTPPSGERQNAHHSSCQRQYPGACVNKNGRPAGFRPSPHDLQSSRSGTDCARRHRPHRPPRGPPGVPRDCGRARRGQMNDEVSARDGDNPPSTLSEQLKARLKERAEQEGVKKISTYALAAVLNDQARRAGRRLPKGKKEFVTPQYLGMIIRGEQEDPRLSVAEELANYLGCTLDELTGRVRDQADVLERLRRAGLEDIGMRAASLEPDRLKTLSGMLDVLEQNDQ